MDFEKWYSQWRWQRLRAGWYASNNDDGDRQPYGWAVFPKKNGKFWVEASGASGNKVSLPFQEFDDLESAQRWCGQYEWDRQENFSKPFKQDEDYKPIRF